MTPAEILDACLVDPKHNEHHTCGAECDGRNVNRACRDCAEAAIAAAVLAERGACAQMLEGEAAGWNRLSAARQGLLDLAAAIRARGSR